MRSVPPLADRRCCTWRPTPSGVKRQLQRADRRNAESGGRNDRPTGTAWLGTEYDNGELKMALRGFKGLTFTQVLLTRPTVSARDVVATLEHFAIVSYAVPADRVRPYVHEAFDLDCFSREGGTPLVWVSMVPFED
jgi:Uncharacterized conserved protein (COG2071)